MSIVNKFISSIGIPGIEPPDDGKTYSLSELCLMDDGDLGKLYRACINKNIPAGLRGTLFKGSLIGGLGCFLFEALMFIPVQPIMATVLVTIPLVIGGFGLGLVSIILIIEEKIESLLNKVTRNSNLYEFQEGLQTCGNKQSRLNVFIEDMSHSLKSNRIINKYSDDELGQLLKIVLPVMKLIHDGGVLNDETFEILDSDFDLSGKMRAFHDDITTRVANEIENEDLEAERAKSAQQKSITSNIVMDLNDVISKQHENDNRKDTLKKSIEMKRIIDANERLEEKKAELTRSLAGQQPN